MPLPWEDDDEGHDVVERGEFYECQKCGKLATARLKLRKTECTDDED